MDLAQDMTSSPGGMLTLERAFALARSGEYQTAKQISKRLRAEGYDWKQIEGPALLRQLRALMEAARPRDDTSNSRQA